MVEFLLSIEPALRLLTFAGLFALMAGWEVLAPRRAQRIGRGRRWPSNLAVVALDTALVRLVFPMTAIGLAILAEARDAVAQTGGRKLILANGCSVPDDTPEEWLEAARDAVDQLDVE